MPTYKVIQRKNAVNIIYCNLKQQYLPIGMVVEPKHFIKSADRKKATDRYIKPTHPDWEQLNAIINNRLSELRNYCNRYFLDHNSYPAPQTLRGFFKNTDKAPTVVPFNKLWGDFINHQRTRGHRPVCESRVKHYYTALNHLQAYKPDIAIGDINTGFYNGFKAYLKATRGPAAVDVMISVLKTFLKWAIKHGHSNASLMEVADFKVQTHHRDVIWHPPHELQAIIDVELEPGSHLDLVLDVYLLQCFLGVRHSDLQPDKWSVQNGVITKLAQKTGEEFSIPIRSEAQAILDKYEAMGTTLPSYANQPYNVSLKRLGQLAKLTQPITLVRGRKKYQPGQTVPKYQLLSSHVARATFICNLIQANVQTFKIMRMTGISSEETIKYYADVLQADLHADMALVEQRQGLRITHIAKTA